MSSLKRLVNTPDLYESFKDHLTSLLTVLHKNLEQTTTIEDVYRLQGEIRFCRRLLRLREDVNQADKSYG